MLKKTNKQTKQNKHREVIQKILSPAVWGKKNLTQTKSPISLPPPPPPLFYPSKVKWSTLIQSEFRVMCKLSNKKNKTSCGEKQQQQPELPKGEFRPARAMCM